MSTDRTTEILNYLSAMSREIGTFRAETKQQFVEVNSRLDSLETRVGNVETEMRTGFEQVRKDIRALTHQYDEFAVDLMALRGRQRDLEKRTEVLEKKAGITDSV